MASRSRILASIISSFHSVTCPLHLRSLLAYSLRFACRNPAGSRNLVMTSTEPMPEENFWLFGYGSLIWKPPPHFERRVPGFVTGYVRRFWQASEDHRGTPESPGRVVTLIEKSFWKTLHDPQRESEQDRLWGVAYKIIPDKVKEVQEYLDIREINGYSIQYTPFHPADSSQPEIRCLVYIGLPDNPQFLGALDPAQVAAKINESIGPSGENRDYLLELEAALERLSPESHDEHISDLAKRVRAMPVVIRNSEPAMAAGAPLHRVGSTKERGETEE